AAILMARCGYSDAAVLWLRWLADSCGNEGGSLSIGGVRGTLGSWGGADEARRDPRAREIMQLDANLGIVAAIHELLVQSRGDGIVVLPEVPYRWPDFSFDGIRTAGAFLIGATVRDRQVEEVRVTSLVGGPLRLTVNLGPAWTADGRPMTGNRFETETAAGQTLVLRRARCRPS
ncbi:MAG: glycoside hydrolase family 95-like protein, partial [Anaerolineae bacterium]